MVIIAPLGRFVTAATISISAGPARAGHTPARVTRHRRRSIHVAILYILAVLREFRWTLIGLVAAIVFGSILFGITPAGGAAGVGGEKPNLFMSMYGAWMALL